MQLRQGQTPDSRSLPQHYCIFKPVSPCGNSQFDDADLQCWQATATISFSKTHMQKKKDAVYNALSLENPLIVTVTCTVARRKLEGESSWITKGQGGCVVVACPSRWKSKDFSENSHQTIAIIPSEFNVNQFFWFRVWLISRKHLFQRNLGM